MGGGIERRAESAALREAVRLLEATRWGSGSRYWLDRLLNKGEEDADLNYFCMFGDLGHSGGCANPQARRHFEHLGAAGPKA